MSGDLETLLERAAERGGVPRFVETELRAFMDCDVAAHGLMRVRCADCAHDRLVPFSCQGRGSCPSAPLGSLALPCPLAPARLAEDEWDR